MKTWFCFSSTPMKIIPTHNHLYLDHMYIIHSLRTPMGILNLPQMVHEKVNENEPNIPTHRKETHYHHQSRIYWKTILYLLTHICNRWIFLTMITIFLLFKYWTRFFLGRRQWTLRLYSVSENKKPGFNFKSLKNEKKNHKTNIREW